MIDKKVANRVLTNLDHAAGHVDTLAKSGKLDPKVAADLVKEIDAFADRFQIAAYGEESFHAYQAKVAKVLQKDSDEKFMDTFDKPMKQLEGEKHPALKSFDEDQTMAVTDRDEHAIREIAPEANGTKKQPSWARGPAGKSTRQGATAPEAAAPARKTWAE